MSLTLRPYQTAIIDETRAHLLNGRKAVLIVSPTGSGKTSLTAHMMATALSKGKRAWFTVHRQELLRQSVATLEESAGIHPGIIAAGYGSNGYHAAQVATIQTLMRRWEKYQLPDLLIIDECHHSVAKSWTKLLQAIREAKPSVRIIGLTATPTRLDGRGLGEWFDTIVEGPSTATLIQQGYLSKYKVFAPSTANLTQVHTVAGDYNKAELDEAMRGSRVVGDAVAEYKEKCFGKRALMFLWSVKASEQMAETLNAAGIPAAHIDGTTDDYARIKAVQDFRAGRIKVLTNVEIITEGFDLDAIEACFLLRPTQSLGLYLQMVGRALRPMAGKEHAMIFDHAGLVGAPRPDGTFDVNHGLPDDPREWTLGGLGVKDGKKKPKPIRQCQKCYAVLNVGVSVCPECGFVFEVKGREVEVAEGTLAEIDPALLRRQAKVEQAKAQDLAALETIEKQRGYKPGWAKHVFAARQAKRKPWTPAGYGDDDLSDRMNRTMRPGGLFEDKLHKVADWYRPKK